MANSETSKTEGSSHAPEASEVEADQGSADLEIDAPADAERTGEVTRLLSTWKSGDERAAEDLLPLVYDELRRLASSYLRRVWPHLPFGAGKPSLYWPR